MAVVAQACKRRRGRQRKFSDRAWEKRQAAVRYTGTVLHLCLVATVLFNQIEQNGRLARCRSQRVGRR